jgi:hypothetical protein
MFSSTTFAQQRGQFGTADEAKAMLLKAVAAMKADKGKALDMINKGEGGFLDRDLYPFCFNAGDGKAIAAASPNSKQALGQDVRTLRDATGKLYGLELYTAAQKPEGQITEVSYMFPTPGDPKPVAKVSFVTRAAGVGCGVGYYKALAPTLPREPSDTDDGLLTASEQLKVNADWVALSAWNTIADDKPGAEALSWLARVFLLCRRPRYLLWHAYAATARLRHAVMSRARSSAENP